MICSKSHVRKITYAVSSGQFTSTKQVSLNQD